MQFDKCKDTQPVPILCLRRNRLFVRGHPSRVSTAFKRSASGCPISGKNASACLFNFSSCIITRRYALKCSSIALPALATFLAFSEAKHEREGGHTGGMTKRACISGSDLVLTPSGQKRIEQLNLGDYVAVANGIFEPIITFLHRSSMNATGFLITTSEGPTVTLSGDHLIFIGPNQKAVLAKNIRIGDTLYFTDGDGYLETPVVKVERHPLMGRYSPLTPSGVLLVNDILVSCYSYTDDHNLTHRIVRWLLPFIRSEKLFGPEGILSGNEGVHFLGDALWYNLRHWFLADRMG